MSQIYLTTDLFFRVVTHFRLIVQSVGHSLGIPPALGLLGSVAIPTGFSKAGFSVAASLGIDHPEAPSKTLRPGPSPLPPAPRRLVYVASGGSYLTLPGTAASMVTSPPLLCSSTSRAAHLPVSGPYSSSQDREEVA